MGTLQSLMTGTANTALACPACGRVPHPHRARGALAKLLAAFPLELALHALVLWLHPPLLVAVLTLAVTTTVLVIWVVEPSTMRLLAPWLHAPALRAQAELHDAESLWRMRVTLRDEPGALRSLTHELAALGASVLDLSVHPLTSGVRDEIVVSAPPGLVDTDLARAAAAGGASDIRLWPTTAMTLVDGTTKALALASHVALAPEDLPADRRRRRPRPPAAHPLDGPTGLPPARRALHPRGDRPGTPTRRDRRGSPPGLAAPPRSD